MVHYTFDMGIPPVLRACLFDVTSTTLRSLLHDAKKSRFLLDSGTLGVLGENFLILLLGCADTQPFQCLQ